MRRRQQSAAVPNLRSARRIRFANRRRIVFIVAMALIVVMTTTGGFLAGIQTPKTADPGRDRLSFAAYENRLADQEDLCVEIEKINLQAELDREKSLSDALAGTIEVKDKQMTNLENSIEVKEKQMTSLEDTILKALMANLSEKTVSRSSSTADFYVKEARSLLDLSSKLTKFKKTTTSAAVDLTSYEKSIEKKLASLPTIRPIPGSLDGYGMRIHPIFGYRQFHPAVDIGAPKGTPIKAAAAGTVMDAGYSSSSGNFIKISHGNGFTTAYLHCNQLDVKAGQTVAKGQVIATVGNTGNSTTPHLHFAIELNNEPLDPARIIME